MKEESKTCITLEDDEVGARRWELRSLWRWAARRALLAKNQHPSQQEQDVGQWEPDLCIQMLRIPAAQNYAAISKLLKQASKRWMLEFLECDGLGVLLESLEKLGARGFSSVADTFSQLQCVSCLRAVMNSQVGLEYIVQHREYTRQLANILMSRNNSVKLQVFELLCALCMYSSKGHGLALDSLNYFKISHGRRYRFDLVIHELQAADTVAYQTTLLAFVNCAILGAPDVSQRNHIRTELFAVGLEKVLAQLRYTEDDGLQIQLKVFDDNQARDEELEEPLSICHLFDVLYQKVVNTPQVLALQSVLLGLSQIDPADPDSDRVWESLQEVVLAVQSKRKAHRRNLSIRTREFGTQTTGKRWLPTKRRASCTIGVQVDAVKISPALSLPMISDTSADRTDLPHSLLPHVSSTSDLTLSANGSVEICKNCLRKFVREEVSSTSSPSRAKEENHENIPNSEPNSSLDQNLKRSFTKIRKCSPPRCLTSQRSNSITVDEPLIKSIIPTQVPPSSSLDENRLSISRTLSDDRTPKDSKSSPFSPPSSNTTCDSSAPTVLRLSSPIQVTSPPLPPPLPQTPLLSLDPLMIPLSQSASTPPIPPPFPSSPAPPPPPPMPSSPTLSHPLPSSLAPPPPPPPMPSSPAPPPPPMPSSSLALSPPSILLSNSVPSTPQSNGLGNPPPPPPPPPPMIPSTPTPNGFASPVSEPFLNSEKVMDSIFASTPYKTTSTNYHTLPSRKLQPMDLEAGYNKFNTLPKPCKKMKRLNWIKVPNQVIGKSVWANTTLPPVSIDYSQIDELFCQKPRPKSLPLQTSTDSQSPALINLLDNKRSLAVNIFLKQFKSGAHGVIQAVRNCEGLHSDQLKGFLMILPDEQEVSLIKSYTGERCTLDTAERFYYDLLQVPNYALRVQAMLQKEECPMSVAELTPQLEAAICMCNSLVRNSNLAEFLALLLQLGNYLNAGSYAGNAAGFKLNTLPKLLDTRANKPRMTFLHFAVDVAQTHRSDLLAFTEEMSLLRTLARNPLTALEEDVKSVASTIRRLDKHIKESKSKDIVPKFEEFLKKSLKDVERLDQLLGKAKVAERSLAIHFCEDPNKFQMDECFLLLADFFSKVKQAIVDNEQMKKQEERAARIEAERSSISATITRRKKSAKQKIFHKEDEADLVDILMSEIKLGNFKMRQSIPAANG